MKKILFVSVILSSLVLVSGCEGSSASNSDKVYETTEIVTKAVTTEDITTEPTEDVTESVATIKNESELFEKDENVISILKNGYSFEGMGTPTVSFNAKNNTYIVVAPTATDEPGNEFDVMNGNDKWKQYVDKFSDLTKKIIETALIADEDKDINFRITHTLKTPSPLIVYDNNDVQFDLYSSIESDKAFYILQTQCDLYLANSFDDIKIQHNMEQNNYTIDFYSHLDTYDIIDNTDLVSSFIETNKSFKNIVSAYGNPDLIFNLYSSEEKIYTIENGNLTYEINK